MSSLQTTVSPSKKDIFTFFLEIALEEIDSSVD